MPKYSPRSSERLATCHLLLQQIFNEAIRHYDCSVLCGHRGEVEQMIAYQEGKSKLAWPNSKHNELPSLAVDVVPYPIIWPGANKKDLARFYYFGGFVLGLAQAMEIPLRWGGDWDGDRDIHEQSFDDLPHFEILDPA